VINKKAPEKISGALLFAADEQGKNNTKLIKH
jgi:hypothetical protein